MNQVPGVAKLSGSRLQAFLDDTDEAIDQQVEADVDEDIIRAGLAATLFKQICHADSMGTVYKLHRLWLRAHQTEQALSVLNEQAPAVVQALPYEERHQAEVAVAFWQMSAHSQAQELGQGDAGFRAALLHAEAVLGKQPAAEQSDEDWNRLASWAHDGGDFELQRRCIKAIHARELAQEERAPFRAWDEAVFSLQTGKSFASQGDMIQARACAQTTIAVLEGAAPDQDVNHHDWLKLSAALVELFPEGLPAVAKNIRERLPPDTSLPVRRGVEVRVARLEATVAAAQGRLDEALVKGLQGHHALTEDDDDSFSCLMMDWHIKKNQTEAAAHLAFQSVLNDRGDSAEHGCRLALKHANMAHDTHPFWALTLACAVRDENLSWLWGEEDPDDYAQRHIDLADRLAPSHPATATVMGLRKLQADRNDPSALRLLEIAAKHQEFATSEVVEHLWFSRMRVLGVSKALSMPFVPCGAAGWCYNVGVALTHRVEENRPQGIEWDSKAIENLGAKYYEQGLFQFESFFASGRGHFKDSDLHCYSMLCNNLGCYYYFNANAPEKALPLHHKGIAASSFAEHYDGVMRCHHKLEQLAEYIAAADRLWHYALENGYSRHSPPSYVNWVCSALADLNRNSEVAIWLQRLDEWWNSLSKEEQQENENEYLGALPTTLAVLADTQPEDALIKLETHLPQLLAAQDPGWTRVVGLIFKRAGQPARALELYKLAASQGNPDLDDHKKQRQYALESVTSAVEAMSIRKPWWKLW